MKRREALKKIGITSGFVLATPSIVSMLQSCTNDTKNWIPQFFSEEQGTVLRSMVDVFLPKTDIPSATEVNVPEFIDTYSNEVMDVKAQNRIKRAFDGLVSLLQTDYNEDVSKVTDENYKNLLDNHMLGNTYAPETEAMTTSDLLNSMKWMTINAYKISEVVGETVLAYDPVPTTYYCGDLNELTGGKSWSL